MHQTAEIVNIGDICIGGNLPLAIQSMTNVAIADISATVLQCKQLFDAGAELVRLSVPRSNDVACLAEVKKQLNAAGYHLPLVADVHFSAEIAEECARIVEKVRINPGNYIDKRANYKMQALSENDYKLELEKMYRKLLPLINICKEYGTTLRIGSNHGSLSDRILTKYGNNATGMVEAAMEFLTIFESENFNRLVVSMKASNVEIMKSACRLLNTRMQEQGRVFPQHLGVTEAGFGLSGRIKSTLGLIPLLKENIGSTLRVSLTENPVNEIIFAKKLIKLLDQNENKKVVTNNTNGTIEFVPSSNDVEEAIIELCSAFNDISAKEEIKDLIVKKDFRNEKASNLSAEFLQATGLKISMAEFISCPGCGRTNYDLEQISMAVKREFSHLKGLKIATMGCVVNGPGEMVGADYGCVGSSKGHVIIYKQQEPILRDVPQEQAVEALKKVIIANGDWQ